MSDKNHSQVLIHSDERARKTTNSNSDIYTANVIKTKEKEEKPKNGDR